MGRWQPDACGRLQKAALELYGERGFENTTVAEIAERAGLTKRTYFRHFADKREVLFWGSEQLEELFVTGVADAPPSASPMEAVAGALDGVAALFDDRRVPAAQRQRIIATTPELHERELIKLASLGAAVAQALRERGVGDPAAILIAEAAVTVFRVAFARWVQDDNDLALDQLMRDSLEALRTATA
jgi:AcrR family transcriptional regulator